MAGRRLGRQFGWLWAAYTVSVTGTWFAFDAFPLIAILVLHAGPAAVALLAAAGRAVGAVAALPLGPWVEFRRKRSVMVAMDLTRFLAVISVPAAYALGRLSLAQLVVVSIIVASADIAFSAASGAYLKTLVGQEDLLVASVRLESTSWTASAIAPPLGGAAIGLLGPVTTVIANAVSFLGSAAAIWAIRDAEPAPAVGARGHLRHLRGRDIAAGWGCILSHQRLRLLFANTVLVNGLILATAPLMAVLMLGDLGFAPWEYGLAFGAPCVGGLIGSRLARRLVMRYGEPSVLRASGGLRVCWLLGLAFVRPGIAGLVLVMVVQFAVITCIGVFNPVFSAYRLQVTPPDLVARVLTAWSVTSKLSVAAMTALWGVLAGLTSPRAAVAIAGLLILATPILLRHADRAAASAAHARTAPTLPVPTGSGRRP